MSAGQPDVLAKILARKREEIAELAGKFSRPALERAAQAADAPRGFAHALDLAAGRGAGVIAEIKKASPSKGLIRADFDPAWLAKEYEGGGAACLSVLTDRDFFQGHAEHLRQARRACGLPVIRKDFLIDPLQVLEARALGADCILLIAAALASTPLRELARLATGLGMDVLVEVHDRAELEAVVGADLPPVLLGINNRNLRTFETRLEVTLGLLPLVPSGTEVVTESGIFTRADLARMQAAGVRRFLIGESLMRQQSPAEALESFRRGRRGVSSDPPFPETKAAGAYAPPTRIRSIHVLALVLGQLALSVDHDVAALGADHAVLLQLLEHAAGHLARAAGQARQLLAAIAHHDAGGVAPRRPACVTSKLQQLLRAKRPGHVQEGQVAQAAGWYRAGARRAGRPPRT